MNIVEIRNRWYWGESIHLICDGCGECVLQFNDDTQWGYIFGLVVHPDHQNRGIAAALMKRAEMLTKDEGFNLITLDVEKGHKWQKEWYERLGYEEYDKDDELYYMRKKL